jgi:hypothetical protein
MQAISASPDSHRLYHSNSPEPPVIAHETRTNPKRYSDRFPIRWSPAPEEDNTHGSLTPLCLRALWEQGCRRTAISDHVDEGYVWKQVVAVGGFFRRVETDVRRRRGSYLWNARSRGNYVMAISHGNDRSLNWYESLEIDEWMITTIGRRGLNRGHLRLAFPSPTTRQKLIP